MREVVEYYVITENKKIVFNDDEEIEEFYEQYGYEPDEQSCEIKNKLFK